MARYWLVLVVALFGGAGCVRAVSTAAPAPARAPSVPAAALSRLADTVWYISTRAREQGRDTRRFADSLEYGLAVHTYWRSADVLVDALDLEVADSVIISRSEYVQGIRAATETTASDDFAVLFVHRFGTSVRECVRYTAESRIRSRSGVP